MSTPHLPPTTQSLLSRPLNVMSGVNPRRTPIRVRTSIIDLRGNAGGGLAFLRVMSYLTPQRIPVGDMVTRARAILDLLDGKHRMNGGSRDTQALLARKVVAGTLAFRALRGQTLAPVSIPGIDAGEPTKSLALQDVTVIDRTGKPSMAGMTGVIAGNRIQSLGPKGSIAVPPGTQIMAESLLMSPSSMVNSR